MERAGHKPPAVYASGERDFENLLKRDDVDFVYIPTPWEWHVPMCLSAIYWARFRNVFYANTRKDAARINFDDDFIYREVALPIGKRELRLKQLLRKEALVAFKEWERKPDKIQY